MHVASAQTQGRYSLQITRFLRIEIEFKRSNTFYLYYLIRFFE